MRAPDEQQKVHIVSASNANMPMPNAAAANPQNRVARISHHIHKPDSAQNTIAMITRSMLHAIARSAAYGC